MRLSFSNASVKFVEMVGETRFELATPCTQNRCATRLRHSPTLFQLSGDKAAWYFNRFATQKALVGPAGFEPAT